MNKLVWIFGGILIAVAIAGAVVISRTHNAQEHASLEAEQHATGNATLGANGTSVVITYSDTGFTPALVTITPGTTVTWSNESSHALWVIEKDSTSVCPLPSTSSALNECVAVTKGGSYSHTFTSGGTVAYTNKERSTDAGTITITSTNATPNTQPSSTPPAGPLNANVILQ